MLLTRGCEYGIRAVIYLASLPADEPVQVRAVSKELEIPFSFLAKVVGTLVRRGILRSQKGRGGGVALRRPAEEMSLLEVVEAIDGKGHAERCVMGLATCSDETPCPLHRNWSSIRGEVAAMFSEPTVADCAARLRRQIGPTAAPQDA